MPFGLQINDSGGSAILNINDKTIRLAQILSVTSPSSGTTTVSVTSSATPSNSIAVLDNGASASVTSAGNVTLQQSTFSDSGSYNTKLRIYLL